MHHPVSGAVRLTQGERELMTISDSNVPESFAKFLRITYDAFFKGNPLFLAEVGDDSRLHANRAFFFGVAACVAIVLAKIRFHFWMRFSEGAGIPALRPAFSFGFESGRSTALSR